MPQDSVPRPTDAELALLRVLWHRGPSSVRDVLVALNEDRPEPAGYTTVLKTMQIMTTKGLVTRDDSVRPQIYVAAHNESRTRRDLVRDLLARAFDGSHRALVLQALSDKKATAKELAEIDALLDRLEHRR
jgi:BlaI family transcriptional regulator, penicillinase repressor